ncbi:MAG: KpsF/GutQ family sugar-phosphate isomerase [Anaerolineae bacterium]|nr:KpsF/GutQ family sugar-phosphate isomerase [Anaerolineae bacterium]
MTDLAARAEAARDVLLREARAIHQAASRASEGIAQAAELILAHDGKVILSGIGKSGHVARKIAATLCSTGTPGVFMHPAEAVHGDLGLYTPGDPTILLSKSGTTSELLNLVPILHGFHSPLIAILGNPTSPLGQLVDVVVDASVQMEADLHNLAPTSSSTVAMAAGDAIAVLLMQGRGFTPEDFARYHPAGQLGRNLRQQVREVMQAGPDFPFVQPTDTLKQVMIAMTRRALGAACVVDGACQLQGIITDGDLRRALLLHDDIRLLQAYQIMTRHPVTIGPGQLLREALLLMENRPSKISVLPVVEGPTCIGLIRIHDIYSL